MIPNRKHGGNVIFFAVVSTQFAFNTIVQLYNNNYYNMLPQEYISSESVQLIWIAFLHIDVTSGSENYISGGVVVQ